MNNVYAGCRIQYAIYATFASPLPLFPFLCLFFWGVGEAWGALSKSSPDRIKSNDVNAGILQIASGINSSARALVTA